MLNPISLVVIGTVAMLILATGIVFFVLLYHRRMLDHHQEIRKINEQKQLELIQASIRSEEQERSRIATELHDDVGATLSSIRLYLHTAARSATDPEIIHQSRALLDDSIGKIRNISHKLQPATLQQLGLRVSLQGLFDVINKSGTIRAEVAIDEPFPRLPDELELAAYRIFQELINNISKHAGATVLRLETFPAEEGFLLRLRHNGDGLTQDQYEELIYKKGATGLKNIVNRVKSMQASLYFSRDGHWSIIDLNIPVTSGTTILNPQHT